MPKAAQTTTTTRRFLLAGAPPFLLAGTATQTDSRADVGLLDLCFDYKAAFYDLEEMVLDHGRRHGPALPNTAYDKQDQAANRLRDLEAEIVAIPATTAVGRAAKARVLQLSLGYLRAPGPSSAHGLTWSLADDVLRAA